MGVEVSVVSWPPKGVDMEPPGRGHGQPIGGVADEKQRLTEYMAPRGVSTIVGAILCVC